MIRFFRAVEYFNEFLKSVDAALSSRMRLPALPLSLLAHFALSHRHCVNCRAMSVKDDVEKYLSLWKAFWLSVWMMCDHIQVRSHSGRRPR